jgi:hypothetical protein
VRKEVRWFEGKVQGGVDVGLDGDTDALLLT